MTSLSLTGSIQGGRFNIKYHCALYNFETTISLIMQDFILPLLKSQLWRQDRLISTIDKKISLNRNGAEYFDTMGTMSYVAPWVNLVAGRARVIGLMLAELWWRLCWPGGRLGVYPVHGHQSFNRAAGMEPRASDTTDLNTLRPVDAYPRDDSKFVPNQWETALLCNAVSHWLGTNLESTLYICSNNLVARSVPNY